MEVNEPTIVFCRVRQVIICLIVALNLHSRQHLAQLQNAACRVHSAHLLSTQRDCGQLAEPAQHLFC
jgi:stress response protein SCP2